MTSFVNTRNKIPEDQAGKLFSAGISFMCSKAFSAAYYCFELIPHKDFGLLYNKALCCFMVNWYDECHRLLCEAEHLLPGNAGVTADRLPEAFLRYRHDNEPAILSHAAGHPDTAGICTDLAVEGRSSLQTGIAHRSQGHLQPAWPEIQAY